jgi:hypothetical protein
MNRRERLVCKPPLIVNLIGLWNHPVNANRVGCAMKWMFYLLFGLFQLGVQPVWANDASCYAIHDPDRKNVCLAMSKKQNSYCYSVKDHDTKNMCLANVMAQQSYCYSIKSHDMKQQCLAQVK